MRTPRGPSCKVSSIMCSICSFGDRSWSMCEGQHKHSQREKQVYNNSKHVDRCAGLMDEEHACAFMKQHTQS